MDRSASSVAEKRKNPSTLPIMALSATPARMSLAVPPPAKPELKTPKAKTASQPPANAASGNNHPPSAPCHPRKKQRTAPRAAPALTPISAGSANGLRNNPWTPAPARANADPTSAASSTRGRRISQKIARRISETSVDPTSRRQRSATPILTAPNAAAVKRTTGKKTARRMSRRRRRPRRRTSFSGARFTGGARPVRLPRQRMAHGDRNQEMPHH